MIDESKETSSAGLILVVDYRKAFDTVRWDLIHHALQLFGYGSYIASAVRILFKDIKTSVTNYGFSSGYFYPSRGIRQGCCCSPTLLVIAVELLALLVQQSIDIHGITVANHHLKISQYTDDATFFLKNLESLDSLLQLLKSFAEFSGCHINCHKSYLLLLGLHLDPLTHYEGIQIADQITILGITFMYATTDDQHFALNFESKLQKIRGICSTWLNRSLSMKGKVLLISSLMSSVLHYPCANTTTPTRVIVEFKKIITEFFWIGKRGKVAYNVRIQDIADGGLKLPDLHTRIRTTHIYWIKRM